MTVMEGLAKDRFAVMAAVHADPNSSWTRYLARAPELQVVEFLDPVLDDAAGAAALLVGETRRLPHVRHHEARVVPQLAVPEEDDFGDPRSRHKSGRSSPLRHQPTAERTCIR